MISGVLRNFQNKINWAIERIEGFRASADYLLVSYYPEVACFLTGALSGLCVIKFDELEKTYHPILLKSIMALSGIASMYFCVAPIVIKKIKNQLIRISHQNWESKKGIALCLQARDSSNNAFNISPEIVKHYCVLSKVL